MAEQVFYEYPLNERVRVFLRLEALYAELNYFSGFDSSAGMQVAMERMLEIVQTTAKINIKDDLIKTLQGYGAFFSQLETADDIDIKALNRYRSEVNRCLKLLQLLPASVGEIARHDEFLSLMAKRQKMPGSFMRDELPALHNWLSQMPAVLRAQFSNWTSDLRAAMDAISLILELLRATKTTELKIARRGFYQEKLDPSLSPLVIISALDSPFSYPDISWYSGTLTIRFMQVSSRGKTVAVDQDLRFSISYCQL